MRGDRTRRVGKCLKVSLPLPEIARQLADALSVLGTTARARPWRETDVGLCGCSTERAMLSKYRLYEFLAVDRLLDDIEQDRLRETFPEARVGATSLRVCCAVDQDRSPKRAVLMKGSFDVHLMHTNMGTRAMMMRMPKRFLEGVDLGVFVGHVDDIDIRTEGADVMVDVYLGEVAGYDELSEGWDDEGHRLSLVGSLRADVISGDLRLLYLLWLVAVDLDDYVPDDEVEPLPGIGPLTDALREAASFLHIHPDLLEAAAETESTVCGERSQTRGSRTAGHLLTRATEVGEARERAQFQRVLEKNRARLDALQGLGADVWSDVEDALGRRTPAGYKMAIGLLRDLQLLAQRDGDQGAFTHRLKALRERHRQKKTFVAMSADLEMRD